jgi:membrane protease YdiL (CAAX protease family)
MYLTISIIVLAFYTINVPGLKDKALIYWVLGLSGIAIWGVSKGITKVKGSVDFPNPIIWESENVFGKVDRRQTVLMFLIASIIAIYVFFSVAGTPLFQLVAAPQFQVIASTPGVQAILVVFTSSMEDFFFWGVLLALIYGVVYIGTKNQYISMAITGILTPLSFMFFHFLVYGTVNVPASTSVFFFGLMMSLAVLVTRNLLFPFMIHAANNFAITIFSGTGGIPGIMWIGWTIILFMLSMTAVLFFRLRK